MSKCLKSFSFKTLMLYLFCASSLLAVVPVWGQESGENPGSKENPYIVPKAESPIKVDAVLDEEAWSSALFLELTNEHRPGENVPAPVRTEVMLTYDKINLYAAFRCYDPDPSVIRAHLSDRDSVTSGPDDWVGVLLDTFNDERRMFDLLVNPLGIQQDMIEAISGGGSWDAIWESEGRITDWGYIVELSIPFNQLRFQRKDSPQIWGFDAVRKYPRSVGHYIGAFPRDRSNNCYFCQMIKIKGFEGVSPGRNIEIIPTITGVRTDARSDLVAGDLERKNQDFDFGVTGRWGMTPNLTLLGTVNPDDSHVEADAMQLDINRTFALYYPERRPFFTEGADFFGTMENVIYTRTISDPKWGIKLSGKEGTNTVGAFIVQDEMVNLIFPGSQGSSSTSLAIESTASVLRYKRDIGNKYTLGALYTDREADDYFNRVIGLDFDLRLTQKERIRMQLLRSSTRYPDTTADSFNQPEDTFSDELINFAYNHESRTVGWRLGYNQIGKEFRADLGFMPQVGFRKVNGGLMYTWNPKENSWWSALAVGGNIWYTTEMDGKPLNKDFNLWFEYGGPMQGHLSVEGIRSRQMYNGVEFNLRI